MTRGSKRPLAIVAMGGHAFIRPGQPGTIEEHRATAAAVARHLLAFVRRDFRLVITHGNGPQVGELLLQAELCREQTPPMPLDVLVADTEGWLGYVLQQALLNEMRRQDIRRYVVTMVTQVVVDREDPAFDHPTKPVGRFMEEASARRRERELGWTVRHQEGRGWRRVVPSPRPQRIIQRHMIRHAAEEGHIVVACGGGGIPVVQDADGAFSGVEAVIDKDYASSVLARDIEASLLVILTDVPNVYLDFGKPTQRPLGAVTLAEVRNLLTRDDFPAGSMGPKMEAIRDFLEAGGQRGLITDPEHLEDALDGRAGTHFVGRL